MQITQYDDELRVIGFNIIQQAFEECKTAKRRELKEELKQSNQQTKRSMGGRSGIKSSTIKRPKKSIDYQKIKERKVKKIFKIMVLSQYDRNLLKGVLIGMLASKFMTRLEDINQLEKQVEKAVDLRENKKANEQEKDSRRSGEIPAMVDEYSIKQYWDEIKTGLKKSLVKDFESQEMEQKLEVEPADIEYQSERENYVEMENEYEDDQDPSAYQQRVRPQRHIHPQDMQ